MFLRNESVLSLKENSPTAFLTSKLPTRTTPSFMTDLLIIILENFGI